MKAELSQEELKLLLHYDPDTGVFTWKARNCIDGNSRHIKMWNTRYAGSIANSKEFKGYLILSIMGTSYKQHRLAFLYMTGRFPIDQIDHINGIKHDNRISNLREATNSENIQNQIRARSDSKTGILGVSWHKRLKKFAARININGTLKHLGYFNTPEAAQSVYIQAKKEYHPFSTL